MLDLTELRRLCSQGEQFQYLFFWGHQPSKDGRITQLGTDDHVLVEASPYDRIWGIGLKATDDMAKHPDTWQGQNLLGFILMDVRDELTS